MDINLGFLAVENTPIPRETFSSFMQSVCRNDVSVRKRMSQ